ncbi:MAG: TetM/TetW/TetO/TetS family tetracycline resistance ribosomal protection protein, partial [Clostridia bacterium]|nr:TetM/TetW/TetO/TetS family tetracycline resistance ribosomal protection protein [Clostridia bacterium]
TGVNTVLAAVAALCETDYEARLNAPFSAKVYRVRRENGTRYCYVKAMSGTLCAKDEVETPTGVEKVNAVAAAQGAKLTVIPRLCAGQTAAVSGLTCRPGDMIGENAGRSEQELVPPMSVQVKPLGQLTVQNLYLHLRELEEEDPLLSVRAREDDLFVGIMGAVQIEVLGSLLESRFGDRVEFMAPRVIYKETVAAPSVGIGHYEPLRHYAEVWLRLCPGEPGSGVKYESKLAPNSLDENWRRLIYQHIFERVHPGVLTGSALTDVKVQLLAGRAHLKHTEGGDFRESTYRAIRNALMHAENVLLEPYVRFELYMPQEALSRVTGELLTLGAQLDAPEYGEEEVSLCGTCTAAAFWDYPTRFAASTRGHGRLSSRFDRYAPCKNQQEIVEASGYNPLADTKNPPGSVFCSHGAGYYVDWQDVRDWAHCEVEGV